VLFSANFSKACCALKLGNALLKVRSLNEASSGSKDLAKRRLAHLKPFKPRPQTSSLVASKLIGASLGIRHGHLMSKERVAQEKEKLANARGNGHIFVRILWSRV
jgi:hypothetical protein